MKHTVFIISMIAILTLQSCKDSSDEPNSVFSGPWEIVLYEDYFGMHNNSQEFQTWFSEHQQYIQSAYFTNATNSQSWSIEGNDVLLTDYSWYSGSICWRIIINNETENNIKNQISEFESFSISDDQNRHYDKFTGDYRRYEK